MAVPLFTMSIPNYKFYLSIYFYILNCPATIIKAEGAQEATPPYRLLPEGSIRRAPQRAGSVAKMVI